jgi:two-component system phosphate regulon response regulator PhoB
LTKLLLVEDDTLLGETLHERLVKEGYDVLWVQSQADGESAVAKQSFDLVLLDVGLPDGSGFDLARRIRASKSVPIVFMTAMNTAEHRLEGYEIGAEEFIPKPFHLKELLLRVRHVLENHAAARAVHVGERTIDFESQAIVTAAGEREFLSARDFQLLKLLVESAPRVVSRDEILDQLFGEDRFPNHRTVDNAVVRLRQALGGGETIRSVRGIGYQWLGPKVDGANDPSDTAKGS